MTRIGDPDRFAVEYEVLPAHEGTWLLGKTCFWAGGNRLGNDITTSLRDFLFEVEQGRRDHGCRRNDRLFAMAAVEFVALLDSALYLGGSDEVEKRALDEQWARHDISPHTETFDGWRIYLVESSTAARLVYAPTEDAKAATEVGLAPGECDAVLRQVCETLGAVYEGERLRETTAQS